MIGAFRSRAAWAFALMLTAQGAVAQQSVTAEIHKISNSGIGDKIGMVTLSESANGVSLTVDVRELPVGQHGFHVHEHGDCGTAMKDGSPVAGLAAGGHYDPDGAHSHKGPSASGHKGDLPFLMATSGGIAQTVTAPRLKLSDIAGRALVIHDGGDNYSDKPENGGGKGRIACGVVPKP